MKTRNLCLIMHFLLLSCANSQQSISFPTITMKDRTKKDIHLEKLIQFTRSLTWDDKQWPKVLSDITVRIDCLGQESAKKHHKTWRPGEMLRITNLNNGYTLVEPRFKYVDNKTVEPQNIINFSTFQIPTRYQRILIAK